MLLSVFAWETATREVLTHRLFLSQNSQNKIGLQEEEEEKADQGYQLIQHIETVTSVRIDEISLEVSSPTESRIQRNVTSSDEQCYC